MQEFQIVAQRPIRHQLVSFTRHQHFRYFWPQNFF